MLLRALLLTTAVSWTNPAFKAAPETCDSAFVGVPANLYQSVLLIHRRWAAFPETVRVPAWGRENVRETYNVDDRGDGISLWVTHVSSPLAPLGCVSNPFEINGAVSVPAPPPVGPPGDTLTYDVSGRRVRAPMRPGFYLRRLKDGRRAPPIVILR